jgi:hypothetical protein
MGHPLAGSCVALNIIRSIAHDQPQKKFQISLASFQNRGCNTLTDDFAVQTAQFKAGGTAIDSSLLRLSSTVRE